MALSVVKMWCCFVDQAAILRWLLWDVERSTKSKKLHLVRQPPRSGPNPSAPVRFIPPILHGTRAFEALTIPVFVDEQCGRPAVVGAE